MRGSHDRGQCVLATTVQSEPVTGARVSLKIAVLKETRPHERRVAMVPAVADRLVKLGAELHMESGAGAAVNLPDSAFKSAVFSTDRIAIAKNADVLPAVPPPGHEVNEGMKEGQDVGSFVCGHTW